GRRDEHPDFLARAAQRLREGEAAAQRVAVRVLVAEDQDLLVGVDQFLDLVVQVLGLGRGCGGYGWTSSSAPSTAGAAGRTSLRSSLMCTLYSIEGSSSKRNSGENLRFCRRRPSSWRMTPRAETRPAIEAFF